MPCVAAACSVVRPISFERHQDVAKRPVWRTSPYRSQVLWQKLLFLPLGQMVSKALHVHSDIFLSQFDCFAAWQFVDFSVQGLEESLVPATHRGHLNLGHYSERNT
jgi:hypothetical protein